MERLKIGIDLDDVINNLGEVWVDTYNRMYGDNLKVEDIKTWEIQNYAKYGMRVFDALKVPGVCQRLSIQPGARQTIEWMQKFADVYIVTATYPENFLDKVNWLNEHLPTMNPKNIIVCHHKHLIELDYLIDDSPKNMNGFKGKYILFTKPWNEYLTEYKHYPQAENKRVNNWEDIDIFFRFWVKLDKSKDL